MYRDDGLGVTKKRGPQASALEKTLHRIFHRLGLRITTQVNIRKTDFLDIILDLETGRTAPFRKPLETPVYVSKESSHPGSIITRIPGIVSNRLSVISSSEEQFNRSKQPYQEALQKAGYGEKLEYKVPTTQPGRRKNRKRKAIWWNPPYNMAVETNLTKMFYSIIDRAIPKNHAYLSKLFNKNNLKIGYACTRNMGAIISSHNSRIQRQDGQVENDKPCNCRVKANCPLNGHCLIKSIVYRAEISTNEQKDTRFYIGSCSSTFKERFSNHLKSIRHERYGKETTLSSYFWRLKAILNQ